MDKVKVGIVANNKLLTQGIDALLSKYKDISITHVYNDYESLHNSLQSINILIYYIEGYINQHYINLNRLVSSYPKLKILLFTLVTDENFLLRSFKAGAKGIITKDADATELAEAIYTLRNGYDYYSKSISSLIVSNYIHKKDHQYSKLDIERLSKREMEILKLWGEGNTNKDIADKLFISVRTVESHKNHIMQKTNLNSTVDLLKYAIINNIIKI